jgi:N-acetylmuramoyl-L-alanine amidase
MNFASCGTRISSTIIKLIFFTLLSSLPLDAERWDSDGAQHALQEARQKRSEIAQAAQPSLGKYIDCANTYRKVYVKDPHYKHVGDAIFEEAVLYQEMGEKFSNPDYFKTAVKRFLLLVKDYGGNQNCPEALARLGAIYSKNLKDEASAQDAYNLLKREYKYSNAALRLNREEKVASNPVQPKIIAAPPRKEEIPPQQGISIILNIRFWSTSDYTRVTIDLNSETTFEKARLSDPDRIYFDIINSKLSSDLLDRTFKVGDDILKQIRVAQKYSDVARIVLDCSKAGDYTVTEMHNPYRIVIDLYRVGERPPKSSETKPNSGNLAAPPPAIETVPKKKIEPPIQASVHKETDAKSAIPSVEMPPANASKKYDGVSNTSAATRASSLPPVPKEPPLSVDSKLDGSVKPSESEAKPEKTHRIGNISSLPPSINAEPAVTPKAAMPTSQGDRTLTRTLGLKVSRIVIDPGHGGHDQGTVGPSGLLEKDLVLSIAHGLQKILQDKLGAEVVLTRNDDTFIPLEERTAIANQHRADLFISIHANSSKIRTISGVETYYLSFAKTDAEREIAARENATTLNNVADLEDLIKKIARADKSAESRELASTIQKKLFSGAKQLLPSTHNRGVRRAPFIVLIGANMPSVLAEVAFISNPKDEKLLKKETNQDYLVKAIFSGIESYVKTLGSDANLNKQVQKQ